MLTLQRKKKEYENTCVCVCVRVCKFLVIRGCGGKEEVVVVFQGI